MKRIHLALSVGLLGGLVAVGCSGRPQLFPSSDPALRKSSAEFAADAAKRFPFKADAPKGGPAMARAQVGYTLNKLEIANNSAEDWTDVEVWVNESYVIFLPTMQRGKLKSIPFQMLFNDQGKYFPLNNKEALVNKVDVYMGGKMYEVPKQMAD